MTIESAPFSEFASAADGLAATAANSSLRRVYELCFADPSRARLHEAMVLGALSERIGIRLLEGASALAANDRTKASQQWSRAFLLMNRLARFATAGSLPRLASHQKSGNAG
jgi:hypothetical protein